MKNQSIMKIFYRLFFVAAIFFSVFVLSQLGDNFVAMGIAGVVVLIAGYLFFSQNEKEKQEERERERLELDRKLDELLNAQRAIYTITKRGNAKIEKELSAANENAQIRKILEKIVSAQERALSENRKLAQIQVNALKTVAKYNKENARQLALNINQNTDRLSERLQSDTAELKQGIRGTTEAIEEAEEFYQNMSVSKANMQESKTDRSEAVPDLESFAQEVPDLEQIPEPEPFVEEVPDMEPVPEPESFAQEVPDPEPVPEPEPILEPAKEELPPPMPVISDPNKKLDADEIAALFASMGTGGGPDAGAVSEPEPIVEAVSEPEPLEMSIPIPEPEQILIPDPEPIQTPPPMPVMDDPNKKMSPDDIAALIAALTPQE